MKEDNVRQNSLKAWLLAARPKTLTGAAVPVMIGLSLAFVDCREYGDDVFIRLCPWQRRFSHKTRTAQGLHARLGKHRGHEAGHRLDHRCSVPYRTAAGVVRRTGNDCCRIVVCRILLPLHHPSVVPRTGRRAGAGILRHRACLLHLLRADWSSTDCSSSTTIATAITTKLTANERWWY